MVDVSHLLLARLHKEAGHIERAVEQYEKDSVHLEPLTITEVTEACRMTAPGASIETKVIDDSSNNSSDPSFQAQNSGRQARTKSKGNRIINIFFNFDIVILQLVL